MSTAARVVISVLVAGALTALVLYWSDVSVAECGRALARLSFATWITAFGLHIAVYLLRTLRYAVLLAPARAPYGRLLAVCFAHTMVAQLLPAKIGEATFALYAQRSFGTPLTVGFAALVVSRMLDLAVLCAGFGAAALALSASDAFPGIDWLAPLGLISLAAAVVLGWLTARSDLLALGTGRMLRFLGLGRTRAGAALAQKIGGLAGALRAARSGKRLVRAASITLVMWCASFTLFAVLARGLGLPQETSIVEAAFGSGLAVLTSLLPLSAFANFGTLEAGWVVGFGALGIPRDLAAATGLAVHAVIVAHLVALGVLAHALLPLKKS